MGKSNEDNPIAGLSSTEIALAGASSGFLTRALIQPFDVLKIRFQLQVEPIVEGARSSKYTSMLQATSLIYREEGLTAFWKGHVPAQMLSVAFGLVQFWSFETLVKMARDADLYGPHQKLVANFICGAVSGTGAIALVYPFDVLKTNLVAQTRGSPPFGIGAMIANAGTTPHGYSALYKGLSPTLLSVGPQTGLQFMFYRLFTKFYKKRTTLHDEGSYLLACLVCGSLAGCLSKVFLYPLEVVRRRMQVPTEMFACNGVVDCALKIYKYEGTVGYFKGLCPGMIKTVVSTAVHLTSFDLICYMMSAGKAVNN